MAGINIWDDDVTKVGPATDYGVMRGETERDSAPAPDHWLKLAQQSFDGSSSYWEANFYRVWQRSLSNFRSRHPAGSKYHADSYRYRSKLFRPKTRSAVRRSEAAANMAFFSTEDAVTVKPENEKDQINMLAAELRAELLNYRTTSTDKAKGMPWFVTLIGAFQDAKVMGAVCSCQDWLFEERVSRIQKPVIDRDTGDTVLDQDGRPATDPVESVEVVKDRPDVRLVPLENIRFHPAANWIDPVNSSPYFIEIMPMYVHEVTEKMDSGEWYRYETVDFAQSRADNYDVVRQERDGRERRDPYEDEDRITPYTNVWVHRNIMRWDGEDWVFHTLGTQARLDDPQPVREVFPQGRPYVIGTAMIETHRVMPSSSVELSRDLQSEANHVANSRLDNVELALNKRFYFRRTGNVDIAALRSNVPGGAVPMDNLDDVREAEFNDVTGSSYQEQDRINVDFDEIMGTFSSGSVNSNRKLNETVGGLNLLSQDSNQITEHEIRIFSETWVEPVLAQIDTLEMHFESDETVMQVAGDKSKFWKQVQAAYMQAYGFEPKVTPELMQGTVAIRVDVGFGATNPQGRIEKLMLATNTVAGVAPNALARIDEDVLIEEAFGILGYKTGARFFHQMDENTDPMVQQLQQQLQELQKQVEVEAHKAEAKAAAEVKVLQAKAELEGPAEGGDNGAAEATKIEIARINAEEQRFATKEKAAIERARYALDRKRFLTEREERDESIMREDSQAEFETTAQERQQQSDDALTAANAQIAQSQASVEKLTQQVVALMDMVKDIPDTSGDSERQAKALDGVMDKLESLETKLQDAQDSLNEQAKAEEKREKARKDIAKYLMRNGSKEIQPLIDKVEK